MVRPRPQPDDPQMSIFDIAPEVAVEPVARERRAKKKARAGFFDEKRPWSRIKDDTVRYLQPYLAKIKYLRRRIVLIDGFAGPGTFGSNEPGSPLLMVQIAEEQAPRRWHAYFANVRRDHHRKLTEAIAARGLADRVTTHHGACAALLRELGADLKDKSDAVFMFIDPFGIVGAEMENMEDLLSRPKTVSTELLINLNTPIIQRLVSRGWDADGARLTAVLGGEWWKEVRDRDGNLDDYASGYVDRLRAFGFEYAGCVAVCDISGKTAEVKYHLAFCSRHPDAAVIMNDMMLNAIDKWAPNSRVAETLYSTLDGIILDIVSAMPGIQRLRLWHRILRDHFAKFKGKDFREAVERLVGSGQMRFTSDSGRLKDTARLWRLSEPVGQAV